MKTILCLSHTRSCHFSPFRRIHFLQFAHVPLNLIPACLGWHRQGNPRHLPVRRLHRRGQEPERRPGGDHRRHHRDPGELNELCSFIEYKKWLAQICFSFFLFCFLLLLFAGLAFFSRRAKDAKEAEEEKQNKQFSLLKQRGKRTCNILHEQHRVNHTVVLGVVGHLCVFT